MPKLLGKQIIQKCIFVFLDNLLRFAYSCNFSILYICIFGYFSVKYPKVPYLKLRKCLSQSPQSVWRSDQRGGIREAKENRDSGDGWLDNF